MFDRLTEAFYETLILRRKLKCKRNSEATELLLSCFAVAFAFSKHSSNTASSKRNLHVVEF